MIARRPLVTIDLLYGRSTLPVSPPPGCVPTVIEKRAMPALAEPRAAVQRALGQPIGLPALREAARGKRAPRLPLHPHTRAGPDGLLLVPPIRALVVPRL